MAQRIYHYQRKDKHDPDEVATVVDVPGVCYSKKCSGRRSNARLTTFFSGEKSFVCQHCGLTDHFVVDDVVYNDPKKFAPFRDDEEPGQPSGQRYIPGLR